MNIVFLIIEISVLLLPVLILKKLLSPENFYLLTFSLILSLATAEVVSRYLDIGNPAQIVYNEEFSNEQKYIYKKKGTLNYRYPDNPRNYFNSNNEVIGHINNLGFRGNNTTIKKPENITRIAFLGDSFTIGWGVKDNDTLPAQLQSIFNRQRNDIEVLNFGVSGTAAGRQVKLLENYVMISNQT